MLARLAGREACKIDYPKRQSHHAALGATAKGLQPPIVTRRRLFLKLLNHDPT